MLIGLYFGTGPIIDLAMRRLHAEVFTPFGGFIVFGILFAALLLASAVMGKIERRRIGDYGLPLHRAFCAQFWQGGAIGFVSLTALLLVLRIAGAFSFGSLVLRGIEIWRYGFVWAVVFLVIVTFEDFLYRGYLLFTLSISIGFWSAAIVTSLLMAAAHYFNPGGHEFRPLFAVFLYCLITCLIVRRTGDLWMPLGVHAAWDWGANFFYGIPSGGQLGQGHLLNPSFHEPEWLTGGIFGPEGGWPSIGLLVLLGLFFSTWLHGVKYPKQEPV